MTDAKHFIAVAEITRHWELRHYAQNLINELELQKDILANARQDSGTETCRKVKFLAEIQRIHAESGIPLSMRRDFVPRARV